MAVEFVYWAAGAYNLAHSLFASVVPHLRETVYATDREQVAEQAKQAGIPCFFHKDNEVLAEQVLNLDPKAVIFYDFDFKRLFKGFRGKKVQLFHGVIEKNWTYSHPGLADFHALLVPGEYAYRRLRQRGFPQERVFIVGFPKLDPLLSGKYRADDVCCREGLNPDMPVVLYCPSHTEVSSEKEMLLVWQEVESAGEVQVIVKLHDGSQCREEYQRAFAGASHVRLTASTDNVALFPAADLLVSDISSSIFEFAVTGKKILQLTFPRQASALARGPCQGMLEKLFRSELGPEVFSPREVPVNINRVLQSPDPFRERRQAVVKEVFAYLDGRAGARAAEAIINVANR